MVAPKPEYIEYESGLYFTQEQVDAENARSRQWRGLHKLTEAELALLPSWPTTHSEQRVFIQQLDDRGRPAGERVELPLVNLTVFLPEPRPTLFGEERGTRTMAGVTLEEYAEFGRVVREYQKEHPDLLVRTKVDLDRETYAGVITVKWWQRGTEEPR